MAHLAFLHDIDPARREQFAAGICRLFAELPHAVVGQATAGPVSCLWAAGPRAPVDLHQSGDQFALLIGYAVDDAGHWVSARELADAWLAADGEAVAHDGYHVGVAFDPARGLAAGVDPLGLFPLYHATLADGGFMVASTPQAFLAHPSMRWQVDRQGLAGILLAHGLLDNRPLLAGTRRLPMGHRLHAAPNALVRERLFFAPRDMTPPRETFLETQERIGDLLLATIRRHRPPGDDSLLMLSGGLDSRLLAGCLSDLGIPTRAVTFGRPRDYEVLAATAVAERLGMPIERISTEDSDGDFTARIRQVVRFNHLSSGPGGEDFAAGLRDAATRARFLWSGIPFDWVFEPVSTLSGYDPVTQTWSFDRLVAAITAWGVPIERLPALMGVDGADLVGRVTADLETECTRGLLPPELQGSLVRWNQRVRNHLAAALHQTSFSAWPLMPSTDRRFFEALFALPVPMLTDRRLEKAILVARRPDLAAIPLDTNSFSFAPLVAVGPAPGRIEQVTRALGQRFRRAIGPFLPWADPRRYERLFDVDQPRWRNVRHAVEPLQSLGGEHLDRGVLAELLPGPDRRLRTRTPLKTGSPIRLLYGLAFVLDQDSGGALSRRGD